jgi:hypothetical protein
MNMAIAAASVVMGRATGFRLALIVPVRPRTATDFRLPPEPPPRPRWAEGDATAGEVEGQDVAAEEVKAE